MKSINKKLLFLLICTMVFSACCSDCGKKEKVNDSRPDNAITYKEMAGMFHQYDVGQKKVLDAYRAEFTGTEDNVESISHYYEINQLKQYIAYLEKISKDKEIKLTGIRIFSAAYPKNHSEKKYRGRQTLIFMPTAEIAGNKEVAFEPLYSEKGTPVKFTEFLNNYSSKETKQVMRASFLPLNYQEDIASSGANRMKPSPPM